jgi:hypothetical protein
MNKEQQRIKIAEAVGWTPTPTGWWTMHPSGIPTGEYPAFTDLPDYLNDLNAMHEAKQALWKMDWGYRYIFNDHLANIIKGRIVNRNEWDAETLLDATAAQLAEAFLRTLNLWGE